MEGGKWGLVIILAAFMIQVLAFGITGAIGVYNIEFLDYFPGHTVQVSLIGSINYGVFLGSGPVVSFLMTKFSYRKIALFGSALIITGLLAVRLLPYLPALCVSLGLLTGFGSSCAYIPSHVLSGLYYDKYRSLATGVATSGSGLGGAIMPVIAGLLIEHYSWKGSFTILAGLCLHLLVFSILLRDPPSILTDDRETEIVIEKPEEKNGQAHFDQEESKAMSNCSWNSTEAQHEEGDMIIKPCSHEDLSIKRTAVQFASLQQICTTKLHVSPSEVNEKSSEDHKCLIQARLRDQNSSSLLSVNSLGIMPGASQVVMIDSGALSHSKLTDATIDSLHQKATTEHKLSRHIYIFTHYGFDVYFASNVMWNAGSAIVNAFGPSYLAENGLDSMEAAWFIGVFGLGCFLGGVLGGVLGNFKWINRQKLYTLSNIVMGVSIIVLPLWPVIAVYLLCLIVGGLAFGVILGLLIVVLTDLIGIENLGNGLGYLMLSNGIGTFLGPPLAGLLKDVTGSFREGILASGVLCVLGGLIMFFMPCQKGHSC